MRCVVFCGSDVRPGRGDETGGVTGRPSSNSAMGAAGK
jgi:hypothetical protein